MVTKIIVLAGIAILMIANALISDSDYVCITCEEAKTKGLCDDNCATCLDYK